MGRFSKMFGAGFGAALAKTILLFLPEMDEASRQAAEYVLYTIITAAFTYMAPPNT